MRTNLLSLDQSGANMYGCLPCPKCGSEYRYPMREDAKEDAGMIRCSDCSFKEQWEIPGARLQGVKP
jgi:transcription elongation factor Elf1